jgi:hypothetical protein
MSSPSPSKQQQQQPPHQAPYHTYPEIYSFTGRWSWSVNMSTDNNNNTNPNTSTSTTTPECDMTELLRTMGFPDSKIAASLKGITRQTVIIHGDELITIYENDSIGKTSYTNIINGGKRIVPSVGGVGKDNRYVTETRFRSASAMPLRMVTVLANGGTIRDERRVEDGGDKMIQIMKYVPRGGDINKPVMVQRTWIRESSQLEKTLRKYQGSWIVDEFRSESIQPLLEKMQLPVGAIREALKVTTIHHMYMCGPGELLMVNSNGSDDRVVIHPVKQGIVVNDDEPDDAEKLLNSKLPSGGSNDCLVSCETDAMLLLSTALREDAVSVDHRQISSNGKEFKQKLMFIQKNMNSSVNSGATVLASTIVNRIWIRHGNYNFYSLQSSSPQKTNNTTIMSTPPPPSNKMNTTTATSSSSSLLLNGSNLPSPIKMVGDTSTVVVVDSSSTLLLPTSDHSIEQPSLVNSTSSQQTSNIEKQIIQPSPKEESTTSSSNQQPPSSFPSPIEIITKIPWILNIFVVLISITLFHARTDLLFLTTLVYIGLRRSKFAPSQLRDNNSTILTWIEVTITFLFAIFLIVFNNQDSESNYSFQIQQQTEAPLLILLCLAGWLRGSIGGPSPWTIHHQWLLYASSLFIACGILFLVGDSLVKGTAPRGVVAFISFAFIVAAYSRLEIDSPQASWNVDDDSTTDIEEEMKTVTELSHPKVTVKITDTRFSPDQKGYVEYKIITTLSDGNISDEYEVWRRYSLFHAFKREVIRDLQLDGLNSDEMDSFDLIPSKRWFGSTSDSVITERKLGLEKFLQGIFSIPSREKVLLQSHHLRSFLGLPPMVGR